MTVPARYRGTRRAAGQARTPVVWDPMATAWSDEPLGQLRMLSPRVSRLLDELLSDWPGFPAVAEEGTAAGLGETPLGDLEELDDAWLVAIELPGVRREDVDIQLAGNRLVVRAERKEAERKEKERKGLLRRSTRTTGRYFFDVVLPGEVDAEDVDASLEDGVLTIRVAKPEAARGGTRRIAIGQTSESQAGEAPSPS